MNLNKFEQFNRRLSGYFELVGLAGLLTMMMVSCINAVSAKLFLWPLPGQVDIVELAQIVAISFALASTKMVGQHVQVEYFASKLPRRAQAVLDIIISLILITLFVLIIWRSLILGYSFQATGQVSLSARIPLYPFPYAIALACIPICLMFLHELLISLVAVVKK
jgi:TRAP-type C4-dicarboxylate transport system permease small subunit